MKIYIKKLTTFIPVFLLTVALPLVSFAQAVPRTSGPGGGGTVLSSCSSGGLYSFLCRIHELLSAILPVLIALGVVYFVYGVVTYFIASDEEAKTSGKDRIIFGVIGLAVILSIWGLVRIVTNTFGTEQPAPTQRQIQDLLPPRQ